MHINIPSFSRFCLSAFVFTFILLVSCSKEDDKIVINPPIADFYFEPDLAFSLKGIKGKFVNTSTSIKSSIWDFGDDVIDSTRSPLHKYATEGTYKVTLKTVGWNNKEVIATKNIVVVRPPDTNSLINGNFVDDQTWSTTFVFGGDIDLNFNDKLNFSCAGTEAGILIHQAVELEGGTYQITADIQTDANQFKTWLEFWVTPDEPVNEAEPSGGSQVIGVSTFDPPCTNAALAGDIVEMNANCKYGDDKVKGQVIITTPGTYYFIIYTGIFDGSYGDYNLNSVGLYKLN
jgi:PKD repeat protein